MLHGDSSMAWALYDEVLEKGLGPNQEMWDALFKGESQTHGEKEGQEGATSQSEIQERLLGILQYMRNNQIYPHHGLATSIKSWFERYES